MANNEIKEIDGELFSYLSNLNLLWLENNKQIMINSITFKELTKLYSLLENEFEYFERLSININDKTEIDLNLVEKFKKFKNISISINY